MTPDLPVRRPVRQGVRRLVSARVVGGHLFIFPIGFDEHLSVDPRCPPTRKTVAGQLDGQIKLLIYPDKIAVVRYLSSLSLNREIEIYRRNTCARDLTMDRRFS